MGAFYVRTAGRGGGGLTRAVLHFPTAGKIFETSTDAREVQIALRFLF
jgi:hypothetical protein